MEMNDKLRVAMLAGYHAIINNKKLEGSLYHNYETEDEMSFNEAAKILICAANGLDPEQHELKVGE